MCYNKIKLLILKMVKLLDSEEKRRQKERKIKMKSLMKSLMSKIRLTINNSNNKMKRTLFKRML